MSVPRMRTIAQCAEYYREQDPETQVTEYYLRKLVKSGEIPVTKSGSKFFINLDILEDYFSNALNETPDVEEVEPEGYGKIRRVE